MQIRPDINAYAKLIQRRCGLIAGQLELTSACFQRCPNCSSWQEHQNGVTKGVWGLEALRHLMNDLCDYKTFEHLTFTGGDPQAWPHLNELFEWWIKRGKPYRLQVSTAFMKPLSTAEVELWREVVADVRVSLDAVSAGLYKKLRGVDIEPQELLERMNLLNHNRLSTITTVTPANLGEVHRIIGALRRLKVRKAMFLPVLGVPLEKSFWIEWEALCLQYKALPDLPTSFAERAAPDYVCPCCAGRAFFHIKANGDYYPCCLVGGEAVETDTRFRLGNVFERDFKFMVEDWRDGNFYSNGTLPCSWLCQYKQIQVNHAVQQVKRTALAMP